MLPFCTLNGSTILHVQDALLRWWCEDIAWTNLRMNYISFTHTLFCVCSDSGMSRCSLASTLSWVSSRQPVSEKCFYFPTEKFQLSSIVKANWQKTLPSARESREERADKMMPLNGHLSSPRQCFRFPLFRRPVRRASSARHRLQKTRCCLKSEKRDFHLT